MTKQYYYTSEPTFINYTQGRGKLFNWRSLPIKFEQNRKPSRHLNLLKAFPLLLNYRIAIDQYGFHILYIKHNREHESCVEQIAAYLFLEQMLPLKTIINGYPSKISGYFWSIPYSVCPFYSCCMSPLTNTLKISNWPFYLTGAHGILIHCSTFSSHVSDVVSWASGHSYSVSLISGSASSTFNLHQYGGSISFCPGLVTVKSV